MNKSFLDQIKSAQQNLTQRDVTVPQTNINSQIQNAQNNILRAQAPQREEPRTPDEMVSQMSDENNQLPYGAKGWKEDGTPDYGEGFMGWLNKHSSEAYAPTVATGVNGEEVYVKPGALKVVGRALWGGVTDVLTAFSYPQQLYYGYLADRRSYEDIADRSNKGRIDMYGDSVIEEAYRALNPISIFGLGSLTTDYDKNRIKTGTNRLPQDEQDLIFKANKIWYKTNVGTMIMNAGIHERYIDSVLAGEDPYKLTKELAKPWANFAADIALDPMNLLGPLTKGATAVEVASGVKTSTVFKAVKVGEEVVDVAQALKTAKATDEVGNIIKATAKIIADNPRDVNKLGGLWDLTQGSKRVQVMDRVNTVLTPMLNATRGNMSAMSDIITGFVKIGSGKADDIEVGLDLLQRHNLAFMALSDNGSETAKFLHYALGELDARKLYDIAKGGDQKKVFEWMSKNLSKATEEMYPDIAEIASKQDEIAKLLKQDKNAVIPEELMKFERFKLSNTAKATALLHKKLQTGIVGDKGIATINENLSMLYLSSPGYAIRNYLNGIAQTFVDLGPKAAIGAVTEVGSAVAHKPGSAYKYIEEAFGLVPDSLVRQFGPVLTAKKGAKGLLAPFEFMRGIAGKGEELLGANVAAKAGRNFSEKMLGHFMADTDELIRAGVPEEFVKAFKAKLMRYNGDQVKSIREISREAFRDPRYVLPEPLQALINQDPFLMEKISVAMSHGNIDEVMSKLDDIDYAEWAKSFDDIDNVVADLLHPESQRIIDDLRHAGVDTGKATRFGKKIAVFEDLLRDMDEFVGKIFSNRLDTFRSMRDSLAKKSDVADMKVWNAVKNLTDDIANGNIKNTTELIAAVGGKKELKAVVKKYLRLNHTDLLDVAKNKLWDMRIASKEEHLAKNLSTLMKYIAERNPNTVAGSAYVELAKRFEISRKYLSADKFEDGKAFLNSVNYYSIRQEFHTAFAEFATILGLKTRIGNRNPASSAFEIVNMERIRLGKGKLGDIKSFDNFREAMTDLRSFAINRERLLGAKNFLKEKFGKDMPDDIKSLYNNLVTYTNMGRITGVDIYSGAIGDRSLARYADDVILQLSEEIEKHGAGLGNELIAKSDELAKLKAEQLGDFAQDFDDVMANLGSDFVRPLDEIPYPKTPLQAEAMPTSGQMYSTAYRGVRERISATKSAVREAFGNPKYLVDDLSPAQQASFDEWLKINGARMVDFKQNLFSHMKETRDFVLLDYAGGKRNFDLALQYVFPYQFWYTRTYGHWAKRLAANPAIANRYMNYREAMEKQNEDMPEYMRNNVRISGDFFGMESGNDIFLNLEASLNPLNGITGIDFTDKKKIVGQPGTMEYAWTNTLDAIGKFGPTTWTPISMAMAAFLYSNGEQDAAARWAGRLLPQSASIKAVGSMFGKNVEIDPFVHLFGQQTGTDPYERRRVGRALMALTESGQITLEQAYEAARESKGEVWDKAVLLSTKNRAVGTLSSYFLGTGMKVRTGYDAEVDRFYEDYYQMWQNSDRFTSEEMRNYQNFIHKKYKFADLILLSSKGGEERDKAYSYSVLSRIAPGQTTAIANAVNLDPELFDKFYSDKGNMRNWNPLDRDNFMTAMVEIGTLISIPPDSTAQKWLEVRQNYRYIDQDIQSRFGSDILDKIDVYYSFSYGSIDQENFKMAYPEVRQALEYRDYLIASSPIVAPYYDGMEKLERYYDGQFREKVEKEVDPDYYEYYKARGLIIDPKEQDVFDKQIGWDAMQKKYNALKAEWDVKVDISMDRYETLLPQSIPTGVQSGVENPSIGQQNIMRELSPVVQQQYPAWNEISETLPIPASLELALEKYFSDGKPFTSTESSMVTRMINSVNLNFGLNIDRDTLLDIAADFYLK